MKSVVGKQGNKLEVAAPCDTPKNPNLSSPYTSPASEKVRSISLASAKENNFRPTTAAKEKWCSSQCHGRIKLHSLYPLQPHLFGPKGVLSHVAGGVDGQAPRLTARAEQVFLLQIPL